MLRKNQRSLCYFMICILLMAGFYTTYVKADIFAERAVSAEAARIYVSGESLTYVEQLQKTDEPLVQSTICVVENMNPEVRAVIGRITSRSISFRRDLRLAGLFFCALCIAAFVLRCWHMEEILCLHEKKYRAALIKYIHDTDGKKKISCLT